MNMHFSRAASRQVQRNRVPALAWPDGRQVDVLRIGQWLAAGWRAASAQPVLWLAITLACADFATLVAMVPLMRPLAVLLAPLAVGALMYAQNRLRNGQPLVIREMFAALSQRRNALFAIGLYGAAIVVAGDMILFAILHLSLTTSVTPYGAHELSIIYCGDDTARTVFQSLASVAIFAVAIGSVWAAPAFVMLQDFAPFDAMTSSLSGAVRNWPVALIYGLVLTAAVLTVPMVPLAGRALMLTPLLTGVLLMSIYGGYRDVFVGR